VTELPPYTAEEAELFDDSLPGQLFKLRGGPAVPTTDPEFAKLVSAADYVGRAKLTTVTRTRYPGQTGVRYQLSMALEEPLRGDALDSPVDIWVNRGSPSLGLLRALDTDAVGTRFIVLLKRYRVRGQMVLHFRAYPDDPSVAEAIAKAP
jgi:hypothetical protein